MTIPDSPLGDDVGGGGDDPRWTDVAPDLPKSKAETELIIKGLTSTYSTVAKFVFLVSPGDGAIIAKNADEMVESWRSLLDNDTKLRKKMLKAVQTAGWGSVLSAHLPIALAIAANHRDNLTHLIKRPTSHTDET